jgi:hypothetical protein
MNRHHFDLLKYIIAIAAYVEKEKTHNKMTAEALAIVLAPTCTGLDGIINKLPNSKEKERERDILGVSLGWNTFNRSTASKNVLPLNVVKDLEQWTALFQFMIINHEKLLVNWTSGFDYEETVSLPHIQKLLVMCNKLKLCIRKTLFLLFLIKMNLRRRKNWSMN